MSDIKSDTAKYLAEAAELERRKKEVQGKELTLKERKVGNELDKITQNDQDLERAKTTNFGSVSDGEIAEIQKDSREYIEAARKAMMFISKEFKDIVPFFRKNLILIGGKTGEGKSTTVANIVSSTMKQSDRETGARKRVLVITNEEKREDVYNRITCLAKGWHYTNHNKFTDEQAATFEKYIPILAKDGWLTVVDDTFGSTKEAPISGMTTSLEGIQTIFDNLIRDEIYYDVVIIDYYQNIKLSKKNPSLDEWKVQAMLAAVLDQYKNTYPAPIVLLAQVSPPDKEGKSSFKSRIEGRKVILNVCTCCIEIVADRENLKTEWIVHKSRFNESVGGKFFTGYSNGRFVPYTPEFQQSVIQIKERRQARGFDQQVGIKIEKEEKNE